MTAALLPTDTAVAEHEPADELDVAEAEAEPGAKQPTYRIVCDATGDAIYTEALLPTPLTSLKQVKARVKRVDALCTRGVHRVETLNALGLWAEYVGRSAKTSGVKVTDRGLQIIIPANPNRPAPKSRADGYELTVSDFFAGCGGSSTGYERVPGLKVVMAVNHWALAIYSHQHNVDSDHDQADISRADPRRYPRTNIGHFSPECTFWSQARGKTRDFDTEFLQMTTDNIHDPDGDTLDPEAAAAEDAKWRSRMLMSDVVKFTLHHEYDVIIVENVTDIFAWWYIDEWEKTIRNIGDGYDGERFVLNSAFVNQMGDAPPQLRDRAYFVFWKKKFRKPNFAKWLRPKSWCPKHAEIVEGIYTPKPGPGRAMRHGAQYHFRCPTNPNHVVEPFVQPARTALDLSLPAQRIADRKTPLKPNTYNRVAAGLDRHGPYLLAGMAGHTYERRPGVRTWPIGQPAPAQTATNTLGMIQPVGGSWNVNAHTLAVPLRAQTTRESQALVVPVEGRDGVSARSSGEPMRAQTARHQDVVVQVDGMLVPLRKGNLAAPAGTDPMGALTTGAQQALIVPLRNHGYAAPAGQEPLPTFAAAGTHHALLMRNNTPRGAAGQMTTCDDEPARAITTAGHQSVIQPAFDALFSYDSKNLRDLDRPLPAQTTIEGDALLHGATDLPRLTPEDCTLRMLAVNEIRAGMGFAPWFQLLGRAKRDLVKQLGNAVTPNVTAVLGAMMFEVITGMDIERYEFDPFAPTLISA